MAKLILFVFIGLLAVNLIMAATDSHCGRHGDSCSSDSECCPNIKCHTYAKRCQVQITAEELMAQRDKILRKGKSSYN